MKNTAGSYLIESQHDSDFKPVKIKYYRKGKENICIAEPRPQSTGDVSEGEGVG
jgi:hypothetical protein